MRFSRILTITDHLRHAGEALAAMLLASMFAAFVLQVVYRYVLVSPLGWTTEWVAIAWLWGILFGYATVVRRGGDIRFDLVYSLLSNRLRGLAALVSSLAVAVIVGRAILPVADYVSFMRLERTAHMGIPMNLIFSVCLLFLAAVVIRALIDAALALRMLLTGTEERDV